MTKTETRTQLRATCPICFRDHAVQAGRMVQHGYQRPEGWHANVGSCSGTNRPHFGTVDGRNWASAEAERVRAYAKTRRERAQAIRSGEVTELRAQVWTTRGHETTTIKFGECDARVWGRAADASIRQAEAEADGAERHAEFVDERVAKWAPAEPREVTVEKSGPLLHGFASFWSGKACAGSAMGARKGNWTKDWALVNCERCLKMKARWDERKSA